MSGPPPKHPDERRRRNVPAGGEWQVAPGDSWEGEVVPDPPDGLTDASEEAWSIWFGSWMASFWQVDDLPTLRRLAKLYDECERLESGEWMSAIADTTGGTGRITRPAIPYGELRQLMDRFGLSPAARQKLRWLPPDGQAEATPAATATESRRYGHLTAV